MSRCESFMLGGPHRCMLEQSHSEDHQGDGFRWNEYGSVNPFQFRRFMLTERIARLEQKLAAARAEAAELQR